MEKGKVLGRENMGRVMEVGSAVARVKVGGTRDTVLHRLAQAPLEQAPVYEHFDRRHAGWTKVVLEPA